MAKILIGAVIFGLLLFLHFQHIEKYFLKIEKSIESNNLILLKVSDSKGKDATEIKLKKMTLNVEAFHDTDCARCHIANETLYLPFMNHVQMNEAEFIEKVRNGSNKMPAYPPEQINDAILKMQYRILQKFYKD